MYEVNIHGIENEKFTIGFTCSESEFQNTTIKQLKERIISEKSLPIEIENMRLIFTGKQLEDDQTFDYYSIKHKSTIMSVVRVPGGFIHLFI